MISHPLQCIFIHIPKTGGTSIEDAIWGTDYRARTEADLWMGQNNQGFNKYQSGGLQHLKAHQIEREVGPDIFQTYFKFSFVRNPWDKAVSQFAYLQQRSDLRALLKLDKSTCFKDYLRQIQTVQHIQWESQHPFIYSPEGISLVDKLGRFENLASDMQTIFQQLGLSKKTVLPHRLKSQRKAYQTYYSAETRDLIRQIYAQDIDLFGYRYETLY